MAGDVVAGIAALVLQCAGPTAPVDMLTRIIAQESGGNPAAVHRNQNGSTDFGLAQINSSNLVWLGETPTTIMEPCANIRAAARVLASLSAYNTGSPTRGLSNGYAEAVLAQRAPDGLPAPPTPSAPPKPSNPWDVFAAIGGQQFVFRPKDH